RMSIIGGVLAALLIFGAVRAWQIERDPTYTASGFRQQFVMSSFRVIGTHPYLGIGPGRYFRDSPNFLTPQLAWSYGSENAHNNFLQITTEAGIIGFFVYAAFFVGALGLAFSALSRNPRDPRLLGATAGVVAFLGTCLTGHPLRVPPRVGSGDRIVVDITSGGVMRARAIVGSTWSSVVLTLPSPEPPLLFNRINLQVNHVARVSDFTPGSTDHRVVGVQVGD